MEGDPLINYAGHRSWNQSALLVDVGNSYIKLTVARAKSPLSSGIKVAIDELDTLEIDLFGISTCIVLPGAQKAAQQWGDWLKRIYPALPLVYLGSDMSIPDVGQYATCGLDRVCAGIGAVSLLPEQLSRVVVVDFGTATTFNAWRRDDSGYPRFAGGLILPGAQSCIDGLAAAAPALPQDITAITSSESVSAFAHSTPEAMQWGMTLGYPAMVRSCLQAMMLDGIETQVFVTGGGIDSAGPRSEWPAHWIAQEQLTALGMMLIFEQSLINSSLEGDIKQ